MPYRRRYRKKRYRKKKGTSYRKNWDNKRSWNPHRTVTLNPSNQVSPYPHKMKVVHKACAHKTISPGSTSPSYQSLLCNGIYDYDTAGSIQQPYLFDQLSPMYTNYCVIGARAKATFTWRTASPTAPCAVFIVKDNDGSYPSTSYVDLLERNFGQIRDGVLPAHSNAKVVLKSDFSVKKDMSISHPLADATLLGSGSDNPSSLHYWGFGAASLDDSTTPTDVDVIIEIEYVTIWIDPADLGGSN